MPFLEDVIAFFAGKDGSIVIGFDLVVYEFVFGPLGFARTEPKLNFVSAIFPEEGVDCRYDQDEHVLERVSFRFKYFLCCGNRIGNDDDVMNVFLLHSRY